MAATCRENSAPVAAAAAAEVGAETEAAPSKPWARFAASAPGKVILFGEHSVVHGKMCVAGSISLRTNVRLDLFKSNRSQVDPIISDLPSHPELLQQLSPSPEQQPPESPPQDAQQDPPQWLPQEPSPRAEPHRLVLSSPSTNAYISWPIASLRRVALAHPAAFPAPTPISPSRLLEEHRAAFEELLDAGEGVASLGGPSERAGVVAFLFLLSRIIGWVGGCVGAPCNATGRVNQHCRCLREAVEFSSTFSLPSSSSPSSSSPTPLTPCSLQPALVTVTSDIPPGAGLGSSAAFSTALAAAMLSAAGSVTPTPSPQSSSLQSTSLQSPSLQSPSAHSSSIEQQSARRGVGGRAGAEVGEEGKRVVSGWAYEAEQIIHGKASGVDNHVCCHGGITSFQQGKAQPIPCALPLTLLLTNTSVPRSTRVLVSGVGALLAAHADSVTAVLQAMHHVALQASQLLQQQGSESRAASASGEAGARGTGAVAQSAAAAQLAVAAAGTDSMANNASVDEPAAAAAAAAAAEPEAVQAKGAAEAAAAVGPSGAVYASLCTLVSMNQGLLSALGVSHGSIDTVCMASARRGLPRIEADDEEDEEEGGEEQPADWRYRSSLYQSDPSPPPAPAGTLHQSQPSMDDAQNLGYGASPIHENSAYRRSQMDNDSASDYNEHLGMPVGSTSPQVGPRNAIVPSGGGFGTFGNATSQAQNDWLAQSGSETPAVRALDPKKDPTEYGYGSVVWKGRTVASADGMEAGAGGGAGNYAYGGMGADGSPTQDQDGDLPTMDEARQPLSRKIHLKSELISPYRLVIVMRLVVTVLFLRWRIMNPVWDAYGLWLVSIICEVWFFFSWILDQFPKWNPIRRETYMDRLSLRFEKPNEDSQLAPVDLFVSTVDPLKEPPLTTANTLLSILAVDYPVDKVACYLSDDGGSMLTFDMMGETAEFARIWVPFCKKYNIEPRAPDVYFIQKVDFLKDKLDTTFVLERRTVKRQYEEFKVRINAHCARFQNVPADGWTMQDGTPWPGNKSRDHPGMIQVFLGPNGGAGTDGVALPRLVYVSREKRPGYNHHKKAGAMNSLVRVAAVLTNAPYILNLDCDHYLNNSRALREAMCFMMDPNVGKRCCYVQFPQRFDGIDPSDRYANNNTVFFDINLPGLDGVQGPVYVGTGCCFRRHALYGFDPPKKEKKPRNGICALCHCIFCCGGCDGRKKKSAELQALAEGGGLSDGKSKGKAKGRKGKGKSGRMERIAEGREEAAAMAMNAMGMGIDDVEGMTEEDEKGSLMALKKFEKRFGASPVFVLSTFHEEGGGVAFTGPGSTLKEAIHVISCGYEEGTDWGKEIGWIYGSVTEDILTGFKMQCRGWRSIYCQPKRVAFKGSAPINLSDRLQQVLRWALGSIEIFLSRHCPIWYGWKANRLKVLQRLAYANTAVYPFTSFPLLAYCMLPAICLFTGKFIIPGLTTIATLYFVGLFAAIIATYVLELRWSGVSMTELWRNEQFWVIGGVSAHLFAVFQGLLKVLAGIDTNFTVTAKQADDGEFAELYMVKWTTLLIPPMFLVIINILGIISGIAQAMNMGTVGMGTMFGKIFFSLWVILHLYPFLKGMSGKNKRVPTLVVVWSILLASVFSLLWADINPWRADATGPTAEECGIRC
ncbi:unnamed protein product [Closterium sp. NIES-54]